MKVSELIAKLQKQIEFEGDLEVVYQEYIGGEVQRINGSTLLNYRFSKNDNSDNKICLF